MSSKIAAYLACGTCLALPRRTGELEVGLTQEGHLQVECSAHGFVGEFPLAELQDMSKMSCSVCKAPLDGREHRH